VNDDGAETIGDLKESFYLPRLGDQSEKGAHKFPEIRLPSELRENRKESEELIEGVSRRRHVDSTAKRTATQRIRANQHFILSVQSSLCDVVRRLCRSSRCKLSVS